MTDDKIGNVQASEDTVLKISGIKRAMFAHISKAKQYVQGTTFMEVDLVRVKELRQTLKASYTSYIVVAVAQAIKDAPLVNSQLDEEQIILKKNINIGVAVDIDGKLIVPVIKDADQLDVSGIDSAIKGFREKAIARKISLEDLSGATFSVSNSGVFGSAFFTPILSFPQSAILGIAGIVDRPVVRDGEIVIRPICMLCLSYDHRVIEGSVAVKFLADIRDRLQNFEL
jgi:pyruvate/2-oxoglutarate dehydrogenase complex dihydrolipoamide acyltransferase (E2) component